MKASLQLNVSQQLTLTPQLQQAIRLLQLSTIDLQQEIQQALDENPLLEAQHEDIDEPESSVTSVDIDDDYQWSTLYEKAFHHHNEDSLSFENRYSTAISLNEHLTWQLHLSTLTDLDKTIGEMLIDACNQEGFLTLPVQDIFDSLKQDYPELEHDEVVAIQHFIQNLDPIGCCSEDLIDCLLVQLKRLDIPKDLKQLTTDLITDSLSLLGQHNYRVIKKEHQINDTRLNQVLTVIQQLNPRPGEMIPKEATEYVIPDVTVRKVGDEWQVSLNNQCLPKLGINNQYASLLKQNPSQSDSQYLKSNLQEAKWFLKSIQSRQETLINVARCLMEKQQGFLEHGEVAMKPLILSDIASQLGLHESTVSRVTTNKYIHTPRGLFELKYFFSSQVQTDSGGSCSSTAIRALIKNLIQEEIGKKPLSDNKIADLIAQQGIQVARRTVAKYREAMGIPPSSARKQLR